MLPSLISAGDWVIDIGANVGHYTKRFSELAGREGRVIAFEPVPETFALLAANLQPFCSSNVTLINAAVSDETNIVGMSIPTSHTGSRNFYRASLSNSIEGEVQVLTLSLDSLTINSRIALVKIDVEGHENEVLKGMERLLHRDRPTLIIETWSKDIEEHLILMGYASQRLAGSSNILFLHDSRQHNAC